MPTGLKIFLALFCGIPILFITMGGASAISQAREYTPGKPIEATVISHAVEMGTTTHENGGASRYYQGRISIRYDVHGKTYENTKLLSDEIAINFTEEDTQREMDDKYPVGTKVPILYDPQNPEAVFFARPLDFGPYMFILFPMIHLMIGVGIGLAFWPKGNTRPAIRSGGWHEIFPKSSIGAKLRNWTILAGIWYTIGGVAIGHYYSVASAPYDSLAIGASTIYGSIGVIFLIGVIYYIRLRRNITDAQVLISDPILRPGALFKLRFNQTLLNAVKVEEMKIGLICDETITTRQGNKTSTSTRELYTDWQESEMDPKMVHMTKLSADLEMVVPQNQPCSSPEDFKGTPKHAWKIAIRTKLADSPDYKADFPVYVTS